MEDSEGNWIDWAISMVHMTASRLKKFHKNHPSETESMLANLDYQLQVLNNNRAKIFLKHEITHCHHEGKGLYAVDQSGVRGSKESRLYFYPDDQARILWILDVGTKESQSTDVPALQGYIRKHLRKDKKDD